LSAWKDSFTLGTLAAASAETGNFDEAVKWEEKSIELGLPESDLKQAQERLNLYKEKKPYHIEPVPAK
jgi:serine/threonine-protein kinase